MKSNNKSIWLGLLILLAVVVGFVFFNNQNTSTLEDSPSVSTTPTTIVQPDVEYADEEIDEYPDVGITAADILEEPEFYEGMEVNLKAEVEEWVGPRAFLLDAAGIIDDSLLVITEDPQYIFEDPEIFGDAIWEVQGTVGRFVTIEAADTLDFDLEPDIYGVYEGKPYVLAESVTLFED